MCTFLLVAAALLLVGCTKDAKCPNITSEKAEAKVERSKANGTLVKVYCKEKPDVLAAVHSSPSTECPNASDIDLILMLINNSC